MAILYIYVLLTSIHTPVVLWCWVGLWIASHSRLGINGPSEPGRLRDVCVCQWFKSFLIWEKPKYLVFSLCPVFIGGPGSSVGIATDFGLEGLGIESQWGRGFLPVQTGPGARPASCTVGTGSFPGIKCSRGVLLTTHPFLAPRSWKSRAIPLPPSGPWPGL